jgi:hypothetical protein
VLELLVDQLAHGGAAVCIPAFLDLQGEADKDVSELV